MRTRARRTGGLGDVGVAGQTPASTAHAEERDTRLRARQRSMLHEVGCRLPAQSALARTATAAPGAQVPRAGSTIRAYARAATYVPTRPRHRHSSTIHALARAATAPVPPIRCLPSAQSARMRAQQPTCQLGHVIGVQAQSALLRTRQPHQSHQSAAWRQHNPRVCAQQHKQLVDDASGHAVRPAHLHARQQPTMLPQPLSRHASGGTRHSSPATPTRLVHEDALCFLARLEKRIFSLGAGDKHGRDSQAD